MVALTCGSRVMSRTSRRVAASDAARLTAVVVFPTPPFWLATAMTLFIRESVRGGGAFEGVTSWAWAPRPLDRGAHPLRHDAVRLARRPLESGALPTLSRGFTQPS